jgi:type I restriction enzyme R subunit
LYAFSDFTHPKTNENLEETALNSLLPKEAIEDRFEQDEYRIMVVANKFQTGFDQPLLSAIFLDKSISGINAVQTVSRLNRQHPEKKQEEILVVDFTNNSEEIFNAFNKHRKGSPYEEKEPKKEVLEEVYAEILNFKVFNEEAIALYINAYLDAEEEARKRNSTADAILSNLDVKYRKEFQDKLPVLEDRKRYVGLLRRYAKLYYFIAQFFKLDEKLNEFIVFADVMAHKLIQKGKTSEMKKLLEKVELHKGAVKYIGNSNNPNPAGESKKTGLKTGQSGSGPTRSTIEMAIASITEKYPISDEEALVIKEICMEVSNDYDIKGKIITNRDNENYLVTSARPRVRKEVTQGYIKREMIDKLEEPIYKDKGGIISLMWRTIINSILGTVG